MRAGETDPTLRRVYGVIYLDDGVTLATDADVSPPAHALQVSVGGGAPVDAAGSFVGDGAGEYYYEFTAGEIAVEGVVAFKLERPGYRTDWFLGEVGDLWVVGETSAAKLRLAIVIFDDSSPPVPATATVTAPSQLQTSLNGVTFADAAGSLTGVAAGLHYYQGVAADSSVEGTLLVRFARAGFQTEVAWTDVSPPTAVVSPASLTSLSPSAGVAPGDPGGFPADVASASLTPVTATIAQGAANVDRILATFVVDGVEEVAFYGGAFRGRYVARSTQSVVGSTLTLSMLRDVGWSRTAGSMTLTLENVPPEVFVLELPSISTAAAEEIASPTVAGSIDHAGEMFLRLPSQFQGKPKIEALVRVLCAPIQQLGDAMDFLEAHSGVDTAFGDRLRALARRVGQPTAGLADDVLQRLIPARVATNKSSGTSSNLIRVTRLVLNSPATDVDVEDRRIATTLVTLTGTSIDPSLVGLLLQFLRRAKSSSTRLKIRYSQTTPTFRFNAGPGFDQGHLASSAE